MARERRQRNGSSDFEPERGALLVALLVSLLAHHALLSFVPPPRCGPADHARARVSVDLYEPEGRAPPETPAPQAPPTAVTTAVPTTAPPAEAAPPPDETPQQRRERRERDVREMRLPRVARAEPPPRPRPEAPQPEPEEQQPQEQRSAVPFQEPLNLHFVHLPPRTDEPETIPDRVRFFAQRTQDVDEETRAAVTTLQGEEAPRAQARAREDQPQAPQDGVADGQPQIDEREGAAEPDRRPQEERREPPRAASRAGSREGPRAREGAQEQPRPAPQPRPQPREGGEGGTQAEATTVAMAGVRTAPAEGGVLQAAEETTARPGMPGEGPTVAAAPPAPAPAPQAAAGVPEAGEAGSGGAGGGPGNALRPQGNADLDWATFERLYHDQLDEQRQAFLERRQERRRLGGSQDRAERVMAQLENFTPDVRPGNQTALDTLYHPFAEYLTAFHRKLHPFWGDGYLVSLVRFPDTHPLNDMTLWAKLEIVVNGDGTIHKITVVKTSGNLVYDVAAIDAVYQGEPYPAPPPDLLSGDGRLYMRWAFYRNHSQCGVWNAEPYILPDPPSLHEEGEPPNSEHPAPASG